MRDPSHVTMTTMTTTTATTAAQSVFRSGFNSKLTSAHPVGGPSSPPRRGEGRLVPRLAGNSQVFQAKWHMDTLCEPVLLKRRSRDDCDNQHRDEEQDRKSTRLNSSHLGISYAVFCLKKKKR